MMFSFDNENKQTGIYLILGNDSETERTALIDEDPIIYNFEDVNTEFGHSNCYDRRNRRKGWSLGSEICWCCEKY